MVAPRVSSGFPVRSTFFLRLLLRFPQAGLRIFRIIASYHHTDETDETDDLALSLFLHTILS